LLTGHVVSTALYGQQAAVEWSQHASKSTNWSYPSWQRALFRTATAHDVFYHLTARAYDVSCDTRPCKVYNSFEEYTHIPSYFIL